jgi:hypothetical protein
MPKEKNGQRKKWVFYGVSAQYLNTKDKETFKILKNKRGK